MKTLILFTFAIIIGLLLPGVVEAVKSCHQCGQSKTDPKCNDPFVPASVPATACPEGKDKYCKKYKMLAGDGKAVIRSCANTCTEQEILYTKTTCCQTDNCNTGMMTTFSITLIMTSLLITYFAKGRF